MSPWGDILTGQLGGDISIDQQPVRRPVDGGGMCSIACRSPGPVRSTCEEPASVRCAVGSWVAGVRVWAVMSRDGGHEGGARRRRALMLPILRLPPEGLMLATL